ncbi:MAG: lipoate--protein ligase [Firmicutes bacterium]|nr:lipoate--protein ligase [Bacillota bacterium]
MLNIINSSTDPYFNMAAEEYSLTTLSQREDCFMLWQNRPTIVIGRHQNAWEEVNSEYIKQHNIALVRRLTGGGAVYHDLGNINFTFIVKDTGTGFDFARFARPIVRALARLGVEAEASGRNDILIDGRKFSGNSEYRRGGRLLHHGTLLFASDLSVLGQALQVKPQKIASKGIKSVRSRVTNIADHLPQPVDQVAFRAAVMEAVTEEFGAELKDYHLTAGDLAAIRQLRAEKYATWEWNYGKAPKFNLQRSQRFDFGEVDVRLQVSNGRIQDCTIYGDFFSNADMSDITALLIGLRYEQQALQRALASLDFGNYFSDLSLEDFLQLLIS